ncbi:MAG TPA: MerR family transcriptional regulator [Jatrophihabitantaceae bacterium]|jgi:DNA-binding transcriptional MerR regulator
MVDEPAELSIGQVAERTGLSVHTLRFYEREGILAQPVRRAAGGRRVYTEHDVDWLTVCTILRGAGMPLPDIRRYTELVQAGDGNEPERLDLLRRHEQRVLDQRQQLDRCLDLIKFKIGVYEDIVEVAGTCSRSDVDLRAERDDAIPGQVEVLAGVGGDARGRDEPALAPGRHPRGL